MANSTNNIPSYLVWDTIIALGIAVGANIVASWIMTRFYAKRSEARLNKLISLNKEVLERMDEDIMELEQQIIRVEKNKKKKKR